MKRPHVFEASQNLHFFSEFIPLNITVILKLKASFIRFICIKKWFVAVILPCKEEYNIRMYIFENIWFFPFLTSRVLKNLGCKNGCHDSMRPTGHGVGGGHLTISTVETLRSRGEALLSRLLWYDKKQFRQFIGMLVVNRDLPFLIPFLHGYLNFCGDPLNPFSTTSSTAVGNGPPSSAGGHPSKLQCSRMWKILL